MSNGPAGRLKRITLHSAAIEMAFDVVRMGWAAAELLPPRTGAIGHEFVDLTATLDALQAFCKPNYLVFPVIIHRMTRETSLRT